MTAAKYFSKVSRIPFAILEDYFLYSLRGVLGGCWTRTKVNQSLDIAGVGFDVECWH